jgi:hypothetical protein
LSSGLVSCTVVVLLPVLVVVASNVYCLQAGWRGGWKGSPVSEAQHAAQKATLTKACMCVHTTCVIGQHEPRKASSRPSRPHMHFPASPSKAVRQHLAPKCCHRATEWRCFSRNCKSTVSAEDLCQLSIYLSISHHAQGHNCRPRITRHYAPQATGCTDIG